MTAAVTELHGLPHPPGQRQGEPVAEGRPPGRRPVDHEGQPAGARGVEESFRARQIRGHRLLDQRREAPPERPHPELGGRRGCRRRSGPRPGRSARGARRRWDGAPRPRAPGRDAPGAVGDGSATATSWPSPPVATAARLRQTWSWWSPRTPTRSRALTSRSGRPRLVAAVDAQDLARDVPSGLRHEVRDGVRDVLRLAVALQRAHLLHARRAAPGPSRRSAASSSRPAPRS